MNRKQIRSLTPEETWKLLLTDAIVEYFVSEFVAEGYFKRDITAMARISFFSYVELLVKRKFGRFNN